MHPDFEILIQLINSEEFYNIEKWEVFELNHIKSFQKKLNKASGIYAIKDDNDRILYIGKAKSIHDRLKSHHKATLGGEKAEAWKQFFEHFCNNLSAHYYIIDKFSSVNEESARKALERILQIKYQPLFDQVYFNRHKKVDDFKAMIKKLTMA